MKKNHIMIIVSILLAFILFLFINTNRIIIDNIMFLSSSEKYENKMNNLLEENLGNYKFTRNIGGFRNNRSYDTWSIWENSNGESCNIFARFNITLLNISLKNLVIEQSLKYKNKADIEKLENFDGKYEILIGEGYKWTKNVVIGP